MANKIKPIREVKQVPKKRNIWPAVVLTVIALAVLTVAMVGVIEKYYASRYPQKAKPTPTPVKINVTKPSENPSVPAPTTTDQTVSNPTPTSVAGIPEAQVVYYGQAGNRMGYYVTNLEMQKYVNRGSGSINAYRGQILYEDKAYDMAFDFRQMKNPKVVLKTDEILLNGILPVISDYKRTNDTGMLYLVINTVGNNAKSQINIGQALYRVDLYYGRAKKTYTRQIGQKGPMTISEVWHDDYVLLKTDNCLTCSNKEPYNWILVNVNNNAVLSLGNVTNIKEDKVNGTVVSRSLVAVKETCGPSDTNCDEFNEKTVYMPSAQPKSQKLP